jgi:hypothetical protein
MYSIESMNGVPVLRSNGRRVLSVWDADWEFGYKLCELLNELDEEPELLLNENDRNWLKAMNHAFRGTLQRA